jgi:hypothetical protein
MAQGEERVMGTAVRDVLWPVVAEVAPEEVPLLDGIKGLDDRQVTKILTRRARKREPLGFGLESIVPVIVPALWLVLTELAEQTADAAIGNVFTRLRRRWTRLLRRRGKRVSAEIPPLTGTQILVVRQQVLDRCREAGIEETRAIAVAEGVAFRLAVDEVDADDGVQGS